MVIDHILRYPLMLGIPETKINEIKFTDDIATTIKSMQRLLTMTEREAAKLGMDFNQYQCLATLNLINRKLQRYRIKTQQLLKIANELIR